MGPYSLCHAQVGRQRAQVKRCNGKTVTRAHAQHRRRSGRPNPADKSHLILAGRVRRHHNDFPFPRADAEHCQNVFAVGDHHQRARPSPRADRRSRTSGKRVARGVQYKGVVESGRNFNRTDVHQFGRLPAAAPLGADNLADLDPLRVKAFAEGARLRAALFTQVALVAQSSSL